MAVQTADAFKSIWYVSDLVPYMEVTSNILESRND